MALRRLKLWTYIRKRWVRRLLGWGALFTIAALLVGMLPLLVNKRILRTKVREWAVDRLALSSPVSVGKVDLALRMNGRTDFYVHDFELDTPNPRFDLPWLFVDTFRASAPVYTLLGGFCADPVVQVRDGVLRLEWDNEGAFNLSGLHFEEGGWTTPVMRHMNIGTIDFLLMQWRVVLKRQDLSGVLRLDGHLRVDEKVVRLDFISRNSPFELHTPVGREIVDLSCSISRLEIERRNHRVRVLSGAVSNFPIRLAEIIMPTLPLPGSTATATGAVHGDGRRWSFDGQLSGIEIPGFSNVLMAQAQLATDDEKQQTFRLELRRKPDLGLAGKVDAQLPDFALAAQRAAGKGWQTLSVYASRLDLDRLATEKTHPWLEYIAANFSSAHIEGGQVRLVGFELGRVALDLLAVNPSTVNISLNGEIAGGKLALLARQVPLSGSGRPRSVLGSLSIPNAADTILRFSGLLPPVLQCSPVRGHGELAIQYDDQKHLFDEKGGTHQPESVSTGTSVKNMGGDLKSALQEASFGLRLDLQDVAISTLTGGAMVQELAGLPRRMIEMENLCRRAQIKPQPELPPSVENIEVLEFSSLQISYDITPNGKRQLRGLLGISPQLGRLEGVGVEGEDGTLRIHFVLKEIPVKMGTENPALSRSVRAALAGLLAEKGLRIDCVVSDKPADSMVEPLYMQDMFRVWSESFLKTAPSK